MEKDKSRQKANHVQICGGSANTVLILGCKAGGRKWVKQVGREPDRKVLNMRMRILILPHRKKEVMRKFQQRNYPYLCLHVCFNVWMGCYVCVCVCVCVCIC